MKGLLRVCLYFYSSLPSFSLFTSFLSFALSALFWLSFACPLVLSLWLFGCGCCFLFPIGLHAKRKGAPCWCVLSCPVVCLLCKIWLAVLVKFVIVSLNLFGDAFIGNCIFVIVSPLLEKAFEDTLNKIPRVKFVLYALLYVV